MNRIPLASVPLLVATLLMSGCFLTRHWIEGKWRFDAERTKAANQAMQQGDSGPVMARLKTLVGGAVGGVVTASLENSVIEFTGTEMRTIQGDSGTSVPYKIIEKPDANTVVIQKEPPPNTVSSEASRKIVTYHRDGAGIWFKPTEGLDIKVYLKRAS